jgi:hypothetical protein
MEPVPKKEIPGYRSVQRAFPKLNSTIELNLTDKEGEPL